MSLKSVNYKGFAYATGEKIVSIESAVNTLKSDVVDASGVVVAFKEEFQDLSGQVQVLDASMAAVEVSVEDLSGVVARLGVSNTFTAENQFSGSFIVDVPSAEGNEITFRNTEVAIQSGLQVYNGPDSHINAAVSGVLNVNQSVFGGVDDRLVNYIVTPKVTLTTDPVDINDATTKGYVDTEVDALLPVYYSQGGSTISMTSTRVDYTDDGFILELPAGTYNFNANLQFSLPGAGYWNDPALNANLTGLQFNLNTGNLSFVGVPAARTDSVSSVQVNVSGRFVLTESTFVKPRFYADGGASPLPITVSARANQVTVIRY